MKISNFSESQIIKPFKENEQGRSVSELSRELGIDTRTFYYWRKKYGGVEQQELKRLKDFEQENNKLKQIYKDVSLDVDGISDRMLSKELKDLEVNKLVKRTIYDTFPPTVKYSVTEHSKTLRPVITALRDWGKIHRAVIISAGN